MTTETIIPALPGAMAVFSYMMPDGTLTSTRHPIIAWRIPPGTDPVAYPVMALSVAEDDMNSPCYIPDDEKLFPGLLAIVEPGRLRIVNEEHRSYETVGSESDLERAVRCAVERGEHTRPRASISMLQPADPDGFDHMPPWQAADFLADPEACLDAMDRGVWSGALRQADPDAS
ncbi:hypothetical protein [Acidiphilium acidophilum]|uniref:hypothetical protein n=1 Tax=Acidiphilium acidophilum TaxID=76588 RepID=UPI002E8E7A22|nr:hypothetical protein [Acidiphilium acidophilum]